MTWNFIEWNANFETSITNLLLSKCIFSFLSEISSQNATKNFIKISDKSRRKSKSFVSLQFHNRMESNSIEGKNSNKNDVMTYFRAQMSIHHSESYLKYYKSHIQNLSLSLYAKRQVKCQKTTNCMRKKKQHHTQKITTINLSKSIVVKNPWKIKCLKFGHIPSCVSSCVWKFASNCISRSSILCLDLFLKKKIIFPPYKFPSERTNKKKILSLYTMWSNQFLSLWLLLLVVLLLLL